MTITQRKFDSLGRREATAVATATTQRVFASLTAPAPVMRQAVSLSNCDAAADLYVAYTNAGASAPSISATDFDLIVPAKGTRELSVGVGLDVWIRSSAAGAVNYTALELE